MIYDISRPVSADMAVYKNRDSKRIKHTWVARMPEQNINESDLASNLHTGTHMDAPLHMVDGGASVDQIDPDLYWGPCRVFDLSKLDRPVEADDLKPYKIQSGERILLKTRNSFEEHFNPEFIYIEVSAAKLLVDIGVKMIGIDAMSVERGKADHPTHSILLEAGLGVLEDIRLAEVPEGSYELTAVPLRLVGLEASPVRALLKKRDANKKTDPWINLP